MAFTTSHHYSRVPNAAPSPNWKSGWSPTSEMSKPRSTLVGSYYDPSSFNKTREMWEKNMAGSEPYASPSQGFDRSGFSRGDPGGSNYRNIELANRRGIASLDEDEGMGALGHLNQWLGGDDEEKGTGGGGFNFPSPLGMVTGAIGRTTRGGRLMEDYQDAAVEEGGSKAQGYKNWEDAKRSMMTASEEKSFKDNTERARLAQTSDERDMYLARAEQAWRNKNTSDRLAASEGFEDYMPGKYSGVGEGSRYTGGYRIVDGELKGPGDLVPGRGRMDEIAKLRGWGSWYPGEGSPRSRAEGQSAIASQMNVPDEDITSAISYGDPDPENDLLYGEPTGTERVASGLSYPEPDMFDTLYGEPTADTFGGMYESPLTDDFYNEELVDTTPYLPSHAKHRFRPRDTYGISQMSPTELDLFGDPILSEEEREKGLMERLLAEEEEEKVKNRLNLYR